MEDAKISKLIEDKVNQLIGRTVNKTSRMSQGAPIGGSVGDVRLGYHKDMVRAYFKSSDGWRFANIYREEPGTSDEITIVTALQLSGSDVQYKTRTLTVDYGLVTFISDESGWVTVT